MVRNSITSTPIVLILASKSNNKIARYKQTQDVDSVREVSRKGILVTLLKHALPLVPKNENQGKFLEALQDNKKSVVIGSGCAGTGKTFLALVAALNLLRQSDNDFEEIIILKSVKMLEGEDIGYLPGDKDEKLQYVYMSYFMQLEKILKKEIYEELKNKEFIKVLPLGAIRGFSITRKTIVIVDEMQNLSVDNAHTVLTRMEAGSKLICIGDEYQRDHRNKKDNGLTYLTEELKGIDNSIEVIQFTKEDSVRSKLIQLLQTKYEEYLDRKETAHRKYLESKNQVTTTEKTESKQSGLLSFFGKHGPR